MNKAKGTNAAPAKRRNEYSSNSIVWLVDLGKIGKRSRYLIVLLVVAVTITITITITIAVTIAITGLLRDSIEDNTDVKNHLPVFKVIYVRQDPLFYRELLELFQNESTVLFGHPIEHIGNVILHE